MSPDEVCKLISSFNEMFEQNLTKITPEEVHRKDPDGTQYLFIYIPKVGSKHGIDGLKLLDGMGYISVEIRYRYINSKKLEEIGHSFRYFNHNHVYSFEYTDDEGRKKQTGTYNFRYDRDLTPKASDELPEHLQVLHNAPRFLTNSIELGDFLRVVKQTCFNKDGSGIKQPFFANRR